MSKKIRPFLWFNDNAEEAIKFYTSLFKNSEIHSMNKMPDGKIVTAAFRLEDEEFMAINAGPQFKFNESISFFVECKDQKEVDYYWNVLLKAGGHEGQCGWIADQFGLWWQIIPEALGELMGDDDREKAGRVMQAMMKMAKIIVADLEKAHRGE